MKVTIKEEYHPLLRGFTSALFAAVGFTLIWFTGFSMANNMMYHNAAHDSRHSFGFPCH